MTEIASILAQADDNVAAGLNRLMQVMRIPSISTDPAYAPDCHRAAQWCLETLRELGFDARLCETEGQPIVLGHDLSAGSDSGPHVLFYGHYDVQPAEPLDLWTHPPFEPCVIEAPDGRVQISGRGASDDKGQFMTFLEACRAWRDAAGSLPLRISILLEGEEEIGGPSMLPFLEAHKAELGADLALICDTEMWNRTTPAITTMLRGYLGEEFTLIAANRDLHSGAYGGPARNPIHVISDLLAKLRDESGCILIPGFYDGVTEPSPATLASWDALRQPDAEVLAAVGLSCPAGEVGFTAQEQIWIRPTCEVNGIWGGYTGVGAKTVIPSQASAKLSFRLVPGQDPHVIRAAFRDYLTTLMPEDCRIEFTGYDTSRAIEMPIDSDALTRCRQALEDEWETPAVLMPDGTSIPIGGDFKSVLGIDTLFVGFALADDNIHSPNEKYDLTSFHKGIRSWVRILAALRA
ncbi:M20/M25/M40 family metallo-hydrolase [Celeribacter persicus]|uniref:Acetylornithine deacetylase/succinyl-diaminopimelate desuccinylase-like protein n=1 Tax=Celeribacter persicus TaxID=1651082 RepID=A0A2T5HW77_9RHOB|nr:M20/M25/M40 family metallo-hydrolase [Celeribacter persicus]PTQ75718.1 acetylornithine deacetylase/succinyl-diaminopimelate desuccinylase-like protein [Celeribacter persicus]